MANVPDPPKPPPPTGPRSQPAGADPTADLGPVPPPLPPRPSADVGETDPTVAMDPTRVLPDEGSGGPEPLRGVVVRAGTDTPVEGANVVVEDTAAQVVGRAVTVADGRFTVPQVPPGSYRLTATRQGLLTASVVHDHPGGRAHLELEPARLSGTVHATDAEPGDPITAEVAARDQAGQVRARTMTEPSGRFVLDGLPEGTYELAASAEGYFTARGQVRLDASTTPIGLELAPAELQGTVLGEATGEPVLDALVQLRSVDGHLAGQATSDPSGRFLIPLAGLAPPVTPPQVTHTLETTADGFEPTTLELTLSDAPADDIEVVLAPAKRSPWLWIGLGVAAVVVIALLVLLLGGRSATVPALTGSSVEQASAALEEADLLLGAIDTVESDALAGTVVQQSHAAGTQVRPDTEIDVVVAAPPGEVAVPNVVGLRSGPAISAIEDAGLLVGLITIQPSAETAEGRVLTANPEAGEIVEPGSEVDLVLATAPEEQPAIEVPRVIGRQEADALRLLDDGGFEVIIEREFSREPEGIVTDQDPDARTEVEPGAVVVIEISRGPEPDDPEPAPEPEPEPEPAPEPEPEPAPEPDPEPAPEPDPDPGENGDRPGLPEMPEMPDLPDLPEDIDTGPIREFFDRLADWLRNLFN